MENASKALLIAASTLIGIMILSLMVYLFGRFGETAKDTENRYSQEELDRLNAKFVGYETGGTHTPADTFDITYARTSGAASSTRTISYHTLFDTSNLVDENYYNKALIGASQNLKTISSVVTCINDAIDTNYQNNNSYAYNNLEVQNTVEVIVDLGSSYKNEFNFSAIKSSPSTHYQYLVIEPSPNVKSKHIYGLTSAHTLTETGNNTDDKRANVSNFSSIYFNDKSNSNYNAISVYDMLDELRDTKAIIQDGKNYMVYKYYFFGEVFTNEVTGLIETVKFTLIKDKNF